GGADHWVPGNGARSPRRLLTSFDRESVGRVKNSGRDFASSGDSRELNAGKALRALQQLLDECGLPRFGAICGAGKIQSRDHQAVRLKAETPVSQFPEALEH